MRPPLSCALLMLSLSLFSLTSYTSAQDSQTATVLMKHYPGTRAVVAVMVNGKGPYDFILDTGATMTIVDQALFAELKLPIQGRIAVYSSAAVSNGLGSTAREISINTLSVQNLSVVGMETLLGGTEYRGVRGILGENFLHNFDILIDNRHKQISLDAGHVLADTLTGDHLAIRFASAPGEEEDAHLRPRVLVRVHDFGDADVLLDSGATEMVLFRWGSPNSRQSDGTALQTINGKLPCEAMLNAVNFSTHNRLEIVVATCVSGTVRPGSHEGILPTAIFKQLFISHAGSYVIVNPVRLRSVSEDGVMLAASSR
jgi:gag-polyprotein putative aspartyl protease